MGNAQSSDGGKDCPSICQALCFGKAPELKDDGEWFGELPREKSKRKKKSKRAVSKLPVVHEESVCSDTIEESTEDISTPLMAEEVTPASAAIPKVAESAAPTASEPIPSRRSPGADAKILKKMKSKRKPKVKLTFVNGQFVDTATEEGRAIVEASSSGASGEGSSAIGGISMTIETGHCGILGPSSRSSSSSGRNSDKADLNVYAVKTIGKLASHANSSFSRARSDMSESRASASSSSVTSIDSVSTRNTVDALSSPADDDKEAVSSILALGGGVFLTASKCDRVIKMWRCETTNGKTAFRFVREFVGHSTGITCLKRVDEKGRFLSASKDRDIKLWDSRYNCEVDDSARVLLATFEKVDRRTTHEIAIVDGGQYVRPTDKVDMAMAAAMTKKAMKEGSASVSRAAKERQIIACGCEFATITGRHPVAKVWSVTLLEEDAIMPLSNNGNVAEVKLAAELAHDSAVESISSSNGMILTGDRMGTVKLWNATKNVFLPGTVRVWSCTRTFSWRPKSQLSSVEESMQFAITSLTFLQGDSMLFVSGSRSGHLRVWNADGTRTTGETINKEVICITGAHSKSITAIVQGPRVEDNKLAFSSAAEDGKVLSFAVPKATAGGCNPTCFCAVNHGIVNRYFPVDPISVTALACVGMPSGAHDVLISGTTGSSGSIHALKSPKAPLQGLQNDALILHRQAMEDESLTLYNIAQRLSIEVETRNRKLQLKSYKNCFIGKDAVSFLVDNEYAATREDAVDLGRVLASHLSLFECVTKSGKLLEDSTKAYYRFSDFLDKQSAVSSSSKSKPSSRA